MKASFIVIFSLLAACSLSACSSQHNVNATIDKQIDSISSSLKQSANEFNFDQKINELNHSINDAGAKVANDPDLKDLGNRAKIGLDKASQTLGNWLNSPASNQKQ